MPWAPSCLDVRGLGEQTCALPRGAAGAGDSSLGPGDAAGSAGRGVGVCSCGCPGCGCPGCGFRARFVAAARAAWWPRLSRRPSVGPFLLRSVQTPRARAKGQVGAVDPVAQLLFSPGRLCLWNKRFRIAIPKCLRQDFLFCALRGKSGGRRLGFLLLSGCSTFFFLKLELLCLPRVLYLVFFFCLRIGFIFLACSPLL